MVKDISKFYKFSYEYLLQQISELFPDNTLANAVLDSYLKPNSIRKPINTISSLYDSLAECLQDYNSMPNVIKYAERRDQFKSILCNFDCNAIVANWDSESLFKKFCEVFPIKNPASPRNLWLRYSKALISGAKFLVEFSDAQKFYDFCDYFQNDVYAKQALPLLLSSEIFGMQFALACNWLKEIGYEDYPKPDTHMMDVFSALKLCECNQLSCYKAMLKLAEKCGVTAFELDRITWLNCTGNFFKDDIVLKKNKLKENYIEALKQEFLNEE